MANTEDETLTEHDMRYHPNGFDPKNMTCSVRANMQGGDDADSLVEAAHISVQRVALQGMSESDDARAKAFIRTALKQKHPSADHREVISSHAPPVLAVSATIAFPDEKGLEKVPLSFSQKMWNPEEHTEHAYSEKDMSRLLERIANPIAVLGPTERHGDVLRFIIDGSDGAYDTKNAKSGKVNSGLSCACVFYDRQNHAFVLNTMYGIGKGEYDGQRRMPLYCNKERNRDIAELGLETRSPMTNVLFTKDELGITANPTQRRSVTVEVMKNKTESEQAPKNELLAYAFNHNRKQYRRLAAQYDAMPKDVKNLFWGEKMSLGQVVENMDKICVAGRRDMSSDQRNAWGHWFIPFFATYRNLEHEYRDYLGKIQHYLSK